MGIVTPGLLLAKLAAAFEEREAVEVDLLLAWDFEMSWE